jgi:hypothetical protein
MQMVQKCFTGAVTRYTMTDYKTYWKYYVSCDSAVGIVTSYPGMVMRDFVMDKSGAGEGFLRELQFPLPTYIPSASPQSSSLSHEAGTIGQEWPQCQ